VTLVVHAEDIFRAVVLARGLELVNSSRGLDIFLHPLTRKTLKLTEEYAMYKHAQKNYHFYDFPYMDTKLIRPPSNIRTTRWRQAWAKLGFVGMESIYSRVVFLDIDILIMKNVDELLTIPRMGMTPDMHCRKGLVGSSHYNSGVMVIEPSKKLTERMLRIIDQQCKRCVGSQMYSEKLFREVGGVKLSPQYNTPSNLCGEMIEVSIYHLFHHKPWREESKHIVKLTGCSRMLMDMWKFNADFVGG
jgi:alpha-N-acetylglucosamine transferase